MQIDRLQAQKLIIDEDIAKQNELLTLLED